MIQEADGTCSRLECDVIHDRADMEFFYSAVFVAAKVNLVEATRWCETTSKVFLTRLPKVNVKWTAIFNAFKWETWTLLLVSFVAVASMIYLKLRISRNPKNRQVAGVTTFFMTLNSIVDQELAYNPRPMWSLSLFWG